jgi:hypothetical protein
VRDHQRRALDTLERAANLEPQQRRWLEAIAAVDGLLGRTQHAYLSALEMGVAGLEPPLAGPKAGGWA